MVKSAYSFQTKKEKVENHIIVVWVDNESGVLARVVGLFSGRGYNIDSLNVTEIDKKKNISRITITTSGTPQVLQQIRLQLRKLVPVHKVADFPSNKKTLIREIFSVFNCRWQWSFEILNANKRLNKIRLDWKVTQKNKRKFFSKW